ncbi:hypothetical protein DI43_08920 [Geobacillus sp. CAMR12739]|nr:hypothetical protein DI43_08920 [Geobacillus sp. CAMR12739]
MILLQRNKKLIRRRNNETQAVFMKDYDGDQIMKQLKTKIENNEELTERDELNLIFLPLMKSTVDCSERAIEAVELAQKITDPEKPIPLIVNDYCCVGQIYR